MWKLGKPWMQPRSRALRQAHQLVEIVWMRVILNLASPNNLAGAALARGLDWEFAPQEHGVVRRNGTVPAGPGLPGNSRL